MKANNWTTQEIPAHFFEELEQIVMARAGKKQGKEIIFLCPEHDDHNPSAAYNPEKHLWHCYTCGAGGGYQNLAKSLGIELPSTNGEFSKKLVASYAYCDEESKPLFVVEKWLDSSGKKSFLQRRPNTKQYGVKGVKQVIYHLDEILNQEHGLTFIAEGEKDADNLRVLEFVATCNPMGAGKWRIEYAVYFVGKDVIIIVDNDRVGRKHAEEIARSLFGKAKRIRVLELPNLPEKGDVSDWLEQGNTREDLLELIEATEDYQPKDQDLEVAQYLIHEPTEIFKQCLKLCKVDTESLSVVEKEGLTQKVFALMATTKLEGTQFDHILQTLKAVTGIGVTSLKKAYRNLLSTQSTTEPLCKVVDGCLCMAKKLGDNWVTIPMCNFNAYITEEITYDNSREKHILFKIEGITNLDEELPVLEVPASEYESLNWMSQWGAKVLVNPGMGVKDYLRFAIQALSSDITYTTVYKHIGWCEIEGNWHYLHNGGVIGTARNLREFTVDLGGALNSYELPNPPESEILKEAVNASYTLLGLSDWLMIPILCAIYRAPLAEVLPVDFSLFLAGLTGTFKTEITALAQAHFGANWSGSNLPANWTATANALEKQAFLAKDALFTVDDFNPTGAVKNRDAYYQDAERLFRAQANQAGRTRMYSDGRLKEAFYPRGLTISSGEDIPQGHSLRARIMFLEIKKGDVNKDKLTTCQQHAREGTYAQAMAGYLKWLAPKIPNLKKELRKLKDDLRNKAGENLSHSRTPDQVASLYLGMKMFLDFVLECGVISKKEHSKASTGTWNTLCFIAANQADHQASADPVSRFIELLASALATGKAHLKTLENHKPDNADLYGWSGDNAQGGHIGWMDSQFIYLEKESTLHCVQKFCKEQGESIPMSGPTLWKRMAELGLLERDPNRKDVRIRIGQGQEKRQKRVVKIRQFVIFNEESA